VAAAARTRLQATNKAEPALKLAGSQPAKAGAE